MQKKLFKVLQAAILGAVLFNVAVFFSFLIPGLGMVVILLACLISNAVGYQNGKPPNILLVFGVLGAMIFAFRSAFRHFGGSTIPKSSFMKPSVVIFDLGKVLVDFDYSRASQRIAAFGSVLPEVVRQFIDHSPLLVRYETGLISTSEFFEAVRHATQFRGTTAEFAAAFADIFTPLDEMIALHAALRARGIPTYILSNTNDLAVAHIRHRYPFFANFDGYVLSYEVGAMKPDAQIYVAAEKLTGKRGAEILFLDDRADNIAAAAARGWQVIHHQTPEATRAVFEKLGLL